MLRGFLLLAFFFLFAHAAPAADPVYVPSRDYAAVAEREIDLSRRSVHLYLYAFNYRAAQPNSLPARLAQALSRAKSRGVRVEVVLDAGEQVWQDIASGGQNREAIRLLRENGVDVFISSGPVLHAKSLIVDESRVLLGSTNWSMSAFSSNAEANAVIHSSSFARALLRDLRSFPRRLPPDSSETFPVPEAFLSADILGRMVTRDDHRGVTAYLYVCGRASEVGVSTAPFALNTEALIRAMGLPGVNRAKDRHQVRVVLRRLREDYGLIEWEQDGYGTDFMVRPLPLPGGSVHVPVDYARYGWDRRLSLSAKTFLLLDRYYAPRSALAPRWSMNQRDLAARHGFRRRVPGHGAIELRRAGLLEVEHAPYVPGINVHRRPNTYTIRPFYDHALLEARFQSLERAHGSAALARARSIAALLYDDADVEAVEEFILLEKRHGPERIDQAIRILGAKDGSNPKRTVGYFIGTVEGLAQAP